MKNCIFCNKEFKEFRSSVKYCSQICRNRFHLEKRKSKTLDSDREIKNRITNKKIKICVGCNKEHTRIKETKFCLKCYRKEYVNSVKNDPDKYGKLLDLHKGYRRKKVRLKRGLPLDHPRLRKKDGEGCIGVQGYKVITMKNHPNSQKNGVMLEHVYIMSTHIGRPLKKTETVHHKNGIRDDNRIENLELWNRKQPPGQRLDDKISWCKEFLEEYGYDVIMKENVKSLNDS